MNQPASTVGTVSDGDKLNILDRVMKQVSGGAQPSDAAQVSDPQADPQPSVVDQVIPGVALQATDTLNPAQPRTGQERVDSGSSPDGSLVEAGGLGQVETEKIPELPVEVEGYLQHVEDHHDQLPQEVVITGDDITVQPSHRPTAPVVVLPITEEDEKLAKGKNTSYGIKWLVEWSHKLIKRFAGKIIYRVK